MKVMVMVTVVEEDCMYVCIPVTAASNSFTLLGVPSGLQYSVGPFAFTALCKSVSAP